MPNLLQPPSEDQPSSGTAPIPKGQNNDGFRDFLKTTECNKHRKCPLQRRHDDHAIFPVLLAHHRTANHSGWRCAEARPSSGSPQSSVQILADPLVPVLSAAVDFLGMCQMC